jgi:hypothetical protein
MLRLSEGHGTAELSSEPRRWCFPEVVEAHSWEHSNDVDFLELNFQLKSDWHFCDRQHIHRTVSIFLAQLPIAIQKYQNFCDHWSTVCCA